MTKLFLATCFFLLGLRNFTQAQGGKSDLVLRPEKPAKSSLGNATVIPADGAIVIEYYASQAAGQTHISKDRAFAELSRVSKQSGAIKILAERNGVSVPEEEVVAAASAAWLHLRKRATGDLDDEFTQEQIVTAMKDLGRVPIDSNPDGADVTVDGMKLFKPTNGHFYMSAGTHTLKVTKDDLRKTQVIEVKPGQNRTVSLKLEKE